MNPLHSVDAVNRALFVLPRNRPNSTLAQGIDKAAAGTKVAREAHTQK